MRIKLNLLQLIPNRNPSVYWLHVDENILFIRQLKEKVNKVLKESRDLELCLDNVPFLDEDDIHAINENEEITVIVKKNNNFTEPNLINAEADTKEPSISVNPSNSIYSTEPIDFKSDNDYESTISSILPKNSKKRVRKRTHKKKKQGSEPALPIETNGFSNTQPENLKTPPNIPSKLHKRFKLDNEENNQQQDTSESSDDDCLQVSREVFVCNSSSFNDNEEQKSNIQPVWRKETPLRTKVTKVPIFVRGQTVTPKNSMQTNESKSNTSEDCDVLVVDWKNMTPMKISNLSDLQVSDLIQFKTLSMNESGEPALSSIITARLEHIYKTTLHIYVLSGIKEFMTLNEKFRLDEEEDPGNQREVEFNDLFEIFKLV